MSERPRMYTRYSASPDFNIIVCSPLVSLQTDDERTRNLIFGQAVSAVDNYRGTYKCGRNGLFEPFAFLTDPQSGKFLVGELQGKWDLINNTFTLRRVTLYAVRETAAQMVELMNVIQTFNPGVPKVSSDSFSYRFFVAES